MNRLLILTVILISTFLSSCVVTEQVAKDETFVFTQDTRDRLENNEIPLNQVQFYLNSTIILERTVSSDSAAVSSGKVILEKGVYKNRIVIPANTPGIFSGTDGSNKLSVSFEAGNSLPFSSNSSGDYIFSPYGSTGNYSVQYDQEMYTVRFGKVEMENSTGSDTVVSGRGYRILDDDEEGSNSQSNRYYYLEDSPAEIKLELKKSEFDNFDLETRVVDGLRVN